MVDALASGASARKGVEVRPKIISFYAISRQPIDLG